MSDQTDIETSSRNETDVYMQTLQSLYDESMEINIGLYETAALLTTNFSKIDADSILKDSTILRVLRYCLRTPISQMKFGQLFQLNIGKFEAEAAVEGSHKYRELQASASSLANFFAKNLDDNRFKWLSNKYSKEELNVALEFAKQWSCSIMSIANSETAYRTRRKNLQENAIRSILEKNKYRLSDNHGTISRPTDLGYGEYRNECKVRARTTQKADFVIHSKKRKKLVLIEAKAVGVQIDSTKRIKECCDKASDWKSSDDLNSPIIVAVIAGHFTLNGLENLRRSNVQIVWEHRLSDLKSII